MHEIINLFTTKYLNEEDIKGFERYKYNSIDTSPIAVYISHPFWNWIVKFYPEWLAPNLLTLGGFSLVMSCFILISFMDYDLTTNSAGSIPLPNWLWLLCFACTFAGHFMDGTDGKQARLTGTSGPIGEFFDHGLDSWAVVPFTITIYSIFGRGPFNLTAVRLLFVLISVQLVFIVSHWEKYNTGVLFLPWGYDASQYGLAIFYLITFFVNHDFWKFYIVDKFSFVDLFEIGFYVCCVGSLAMSVHNIFRAYRVCQTGRQSSFFEAILPLFSSIALFISASFWALFSPFDVIDCDPRIFLWTMGVVFSNIACRLIIAQMSQTRAEVINWLLVPYLLTVSFSLLGVFGSFELLVLRLLAGLLTLAHLHYGICVIQQLCIHFRVQPFSLSYLKRRRD